MFSYVFWLVCVALIGGLLNSGFGSVDCIAYCVWFVILWFLFVFDVVYLVVIAGCCVLLVYGWGF